MEPTNTPTPETNKAMAIIAYLGPLVVVSWAIAKGDPFVKFHIKQGLILLVIEIILWFLSAIFIWSFWYLANLINLIIFVLAIIGIINAAQGNEKELPVVGQFAKHFNF